MISFEKQGIKFNFRVAGIVVINNLILLHRYVKDNFWTFPGGRVEIGEDTESTLKREFMEEINFLIENPELRWIFENYFEYEGIKYHEICFYYKVNIDILPEIITVLDEGRELEFKWFNITALSDLDIKPTEFKKLLLDKEKTIKHIVTRN